MAEELYGISDYPERAVAAIEHLLSRIAADPRLAYYFDPLTRSMEELTEAYSLAKGLGVEEFRTRYYQKLRFERPICPECSEAVR